MLEHTVFGNLRQWAPARWAIRMRATEDFPLDHEGRLSVKKSGLYYIYAQVNYLDEHDVNAFQVPFVNKFCFHTLNLYVKLKLSKVQQCKTVVFSRFFFPTKTISTIFRSMYI